MDYNTEVIRTRNSLIIRWRNEAGDLWTVTKKFNLGTRVLEDAYTHCSTVEFSVDEAKQAEGLALDLNAALQRPEDFDRIKIADQEPENGMPAQIVGIVLGGPIYIAKARSHT
jgi:hypothetical protein